MKKGLVLVMVSGIMVVITILAVAALNLMTVESRTAEHKLRRIRAYFAAQAATVDAFERLRRGQRAIPAAGAPDVYQLGAVNGGNIVNNYDPRVVIIARGTNTVQGGINYNCPAASPSPTCIFATVDYQ
jgi:Tfp pilus assembly protein PilX